jgi:CPA1 family monovalent cation:H+ antiporter
MNWRSIAFLLEGGVFLLIGLQARGIIRDAGDDELGVWQIAGICALTLLTVIVLRLVWVFFARYALVRPGPDETGRVPPWTYTFLLGWAGMRGVVTLAAAFVIPTSTPHYEVLLLIAFAVTAGTLFLQGLSLPWLARVLRVPSPDVGADALARANLLHQASLAGLARLEALEEEDPHDVSQLIRDRVARRDDAAWERLNASDNETPSEIYARRRRTMIDAERRRVLEIRSTGAVPHEVVTEVLAMLDVEESMLDISRDEREEIRLTSAQRRTGETCVDLDAYPAVETPEEPECVDCLREGTAWVALRQCLECGNIGCCDSSPRRHATAHFHEHQHPVIESAEPGEDWRWCYFHHATA